MQFETPDQAVGASATPAGLGRAIAGCPGNASAAPITISPLITSASQFGVTGAQRHGIMISSSPPRLTTQGERKEAPMSRHFDMRTTMRKLLYSNASPFARRVRVVLEEKLLEYEKDVLDAVRPIEDIRATNPALQVPVLHDGDRTLWGSDLIIEYLYASYPDSPNTDADRPLATTIVRPNQQWGDRLLLTTIGSLADSLVNVRMVSGGGDVSAVPYLDRQLTRISACLDWLEPQITPDGFWPGTFSVMDFSLMCPLRYGEVRDVFQYRTGQWPNIVAMIDRLQDRPSVIATPVVQL